MVVLVYHKVMPLRVLIASVALREIVDAEQWCRVDTSGLIEMSHEVV